MTPAIVLAAAVLAQPQPPTRFDVAAGPTLSSLDAVAAQAGVDIVVVADLSRARSPALRGLMSAEEAFDRLLRPSGARAVPLGERLYRIEPLPAPRPRPPARPASPPPPAAPTRLAEVVVTGAPVPRGGLEGANGRDDLDPAALERARGAYGSEALADLSASVDSTRQGPGRNKLFIRGVADSAFNGPLQATVGQYFGDLRLNYGAPDPDLVLVDIRRVDVFEGPQSSRFGAGSIGGVVRITPREPEIGERSLDVFAGGSTTPGGEAGGDLGLVVNAPLGAGAALRLTAYGRIDGGFLDNPARGENDADRITTQGGRLAVRGVHDRWTVDGLVLAQRIAAGDAQTLPLDAAAPVKTRLVAEPYESALALAGVSATRTLQSGRLTVSGSLSRQVLEERFDATEPGEATPTVVDRLQGVTALSLEARLTWDRGGFWSFNGGAAAALGETRVERERGSAPLVHPQSGTVLRRRFAEGALFMEAIAGARPGLDVAVGGRLSFARGRHRIRSAGAGAATLSGAEDTVEVFATPTAAIRWDAPGGAVWFGRLERGARPGSVSESEGVLDRLRPDRTTLAEAGVQWRPPEGSWSAEASVGWLDWRDVQADVVTPGGELVTGNVGDGRVGFVQLKARWDPSPALSLSGDLFLNESRLVLSGPNVIGVAGGDIPNVARSGARLGLVWEAGPVLGLPLGLSADLRYVGRSRPGLGPGLDALQGGYVRADLGARWGGDAAALVVRLSNPHDAWAVRYGVGSPYQLHSPEGAPLRPLTLRIGVEARF